MKSIFTYSLVIILTLMVNSTFAQNTTVLNKIIIEKDTLKKDIPSHTNPVFTYESKLDRLVPDLSISNTTLLKQRSIYDVNKLPIFCKIEHKLAKSSKVNVMMRLGSLDYVNKLEGKN